MCVEGTFRDGADRSFHCLLVEDACAADSQEMHDASLRLLQRLCGGITSIVVPVCAAIITEAAQLSEFVPKQADDTQLEIGEVRDLGERVHHRRSRARVGFRRNRPADHHDRRGATLRSARGEEGS